MFAKKLVKMPYKMLVSFMISWANLVPLKKDPLGGPGIFDNDEGLIMVCKQAHKMQATLDSKKIFVSILVGREIIAESFCGSHTTHSKRYIGSVYAIA